MTTLAPARVSYFFALATQSIAVSKWVAAIDRLRPSASGLFLSSFTVSNIICIAPISAIQCSSVTVHLVRRAGDWIRTSDLLFTKQRLYLTELPRQKKGLAGAGFAPTSPELLTIQALSP